MHPAGWYPDPTGSGAVRYWDGRSWTANLAVPDRSNPPPPPPHPEVPVVMAVGALVSIVASLVASRFVLDALVRIELPIALYVVAAGVLGYGPVLVFCWWGSHRWGRRSLRADSGLYARTTDLGWGPLTWFACVVAQATIAVAVVALGIPFTSNVEELDGPGVERSYVVSLLVLAVVAAPVIEEMVFRGVVMRGLASRLPLAAVIAVQAVAFGLAHVDPVRGAGNIGLVMILTGVGAVLGTVAGLLRRIGPTVIAHAILNGVAMTLALTGWAPD